MCPLCNTGVRADVEPCRAPAEWSEALDALKRSCPNDASCRFGNKVFYESFAEAKDHALNECPLRMVACPNEACGEVLKQHQLKKHLRLCQLKRCKNFRPPRYGCCVTGTVDHVKKHEIKCCFSEIEVLKQIEELVKRRGE